MRAIVQVLLLATALVGPVLLMLAFGLSTERGWGITAAILTSLTATPVALILFGVLRRNQRAARRLRRSGVAATAEVVGVRATATGEDTGVAVTVRLRSNDGGQADGVFSCAYNEHLAVGAVLAARLDAAAGLFSIESPLVHGAVTEI